MTKRTDETTPDTLRALNTKRRAKLELPREVVAEHVRHTEMRQSARTLADWLVQDEILAVQHAQAVLDSKREAVQLLWGTEAEAIYDPADTQQAEQLEALLYDGEALLEGEWLGPPSIVEAFERKFRVRAAFMSDEHKQEEDLNDLRGRALALDQVLDDDEDPAFAGRRSVTVKWFRAVSLTMGALGKLPEISPGRGPILKSGPNGVPLPDESQPQPSEYQFEQHAKRLVGQLREFDRTAFAVNVDDPTQGMKPLRDSVTAVADILKSARKGAHKYTPSTIEGVTAKIARAAGIAWKRDSKKGYDWYNRPQKPASNTSKAPENGAFEESSIGGLLSEDGPTSE